MDEESKWPEQNPVGLQYSIFENSMEANESSKKTKERKVRRNSLKVWYQSSVESIL